MRVLVRGVIYESPHDCAKALKVTVDTVYSAVHNDTTDTLGFGRGWKPKGNPNYGHGRSKEITLGKTTFKSLAEASAALGWKRKRLEQMLKTRGPRQLQTLYAAILILDAKQIKERNNSPVEGTEQENEK